MLISVFDARNNRYGLSRSHERSPLLPPHSSASDDGALDPTPHSPNHQPPSPSGEYQATDVHNPRRDPLPLCLANFTRRSCGRSVVLFIAFTQVVFVIFVYHLVEGKRTAIRGETRKLEKERLALESSTREMQWEQNALEAAIRRSEEERSRFEREEQLLESERQSLEREKEGLREERERWEKARKTRVPNGAFWDPLTPAPDCLAYGKREYHGALQNIPEDWTDMDACMNMSVEIKNVTIKRPNRCAYVEGPPQIHGFWTVDWDQPDCKPWHTDVADKVSLGAILNH